MPISAPTLETTDLEGSGSTMSPFINVTNGDLVVFSCVVVSGVGSATYSGITTTGFTNTGWTNLSIDNGTSMSVISYTEATETAFQVIVPEWSASVGDKRYAVYRFTGHDATTPVAQNDTYQTSSSISSISETFTSTPSADSWLVANVVFDPTDEAASPASGWTEDYDAFQSSIGCGSLQSVDGSNGSGWGGSCTTSQTNGGTGIAIEVQETAAGGTILPLLNAYEG